MSQTPIPKQPKKRSPFFWVIIVCSGLVLLAFGGCIVGLGMLGQRVYKEVGKPLNQEEILANLGDIPIYQPSTFNTTLSRGAQVGGSFIPGQKSFTAAAFDVSGEPAQIVGWYDEQMRSLEYQPVQVDTDDASLQQIAFQKDDQFVIVQVNDALLKQTGQYSLLLIRMEINDLEKSSS